MPKLHLITYGCQMNEYDSERVAGLLRGECYELVADEREADLIIVNTCAIREKAEEKVFSKLVERARRERRPVLETGEGPLVKITARPPAASRLRAFVTVMEGCEKHCTFCVVPQTRGRERSHPPETLLAEVRSLAAEGCREVTLLGQTVNAYGRDLTP